MRARALLPALLTAALTVTAAAGASAQPGGTDEATVRLTGPLLKTADEGGTRQLVGIWAEGRLVPLDPAPLADAAPGDTVTVDVTAPDSVVAAASADRTLTVPTGEPTPARHRLRPAQLRDASDRTPAAASSPFGQATTDAALAPGAPALQVDQVVATTTASAAQAPSTRRITYVEVTPRGATREPVTATVARRQVAGADAFWSEQSDGRLRIAAPTIAAHFTSAYTCSGSDLLRLWSQAADRTGYDGRANATLVIKLPFATYRTCGYGYGQIGLSTSSGGILHVSDTATPVLAHELGHNMGLEHANLLTCATRSDGRLTDTGMWESACSEEEYGDSLDIMGPSTQDDTPMLSAPQALIAGILPPSAATTVGLGTTRVTLRPLSGGTGVRAAVVTDSTTRVRYWVEYRTPTGRDASNPSGQDTGVRVLRLGATSGTVVLDATPTGAPDDRVAVGAGRTFTNRDGRLRVTTESATATQAVVRIDNATKPPALTATAVPRISGTRAVGRTLTASTGTWTPTPTSYTYRWKRNGTAIAGATARTYRLTTADAGHNISVTVTARRSGRTATASTSARTAVPLHATASPWIHAPTPRAGRQVTAMVGSWTPRPDGYAYQWYRNGVAKPGKTDKAYTLNLGDRGQRISVRVTARREGSAKGAKTSASITPR